MADVDSSVPALLMLEYARGVLEALIRREASPHCPPDLRRAEGILVYSATSLGLSEGICQRLSDEGRRRETWDLDATQWPSFADETKYWRQRFEESKALCEPKLATVLEECNRLGFEAAKRGQIVGAGSRGMRQRYMVFETKGGGG